MKSAHRFLWSCKSILLSNHHSIELVVPKPHCCLNLHTSCKQGFLFLSELRSASDTALAHFPMGMTRIQPSRFHMDEE